MLQMRATETSTRRQGVKGHVRARHARAIGHGTIEIKRQPQLQPQPVTTYEGKAPDA